MKLHLLLLGIIVSIGSSSSSPILCHDAERSALLHFNQGFSIQPSASIYPSANPKTLSWKSITGNISSNCCKWDGVECDELSGHVIGLDLSSSYLYGIILSNSTLFELVHLQSLNLSDNNFRYSHIPSRLSRLSNLKYLNLSRCGISGQVPIEVSALSKLISLDLSLNIDSLSGAPLLKLQSPSLSMLVKNLAALEILRLSQVAISSPVPQTLANLTSLKILRLQDCGLYGSFPEGIFQLPQLQYLNLASNIKLTGYIPEIHKASKLEKLILYQCNFKGSIPASLGHLSQLTYLDFSSNNFAWEVPLSLGNLTQLSHLDLSYNNIEGQASFLANLTKLNYLDLSYNRLQGSIGSFISRLINLQGLLLSENNFTGALEFDNIVQNPNLQMLVLSNIKLIFSTDTHNYSYYPQFVILDITACNLNQFPGFIHNQTKFSDLSLSKNNIIGSLPIPPPSVVIYDMEKNDLTGKIPTDICNVTSLKVLNLQFNRLSGRIPPCLFNFSNYLELLDLNQNDLHGKIPEAFPSSCKLKWFDLGSNRLEGALPRSLANCSFLKVLALDHNNIVDNFPIWLSGLPGLQALLLQSNKLHGPLPPKLGVGFPQLSWIILSDNKFTGTMSEELFDDLYAMLKPTLQLSELELEVSLNLLGGEMAVVYPMARPIGGDLSQLGSKYPVMSLELSNNRLVGKVPDSIGNLTGLQYLDLSHNNLNGSIPFSFADLTNILLLDLSHNLLTGEIPQQLTQLSFLSQLDVSYNKLTGPIPQGGQFSTFNNDSFIGNALLCGSPLTHKCGDTEVQVASPDESHDSSSENEEDSIDIIGWVIRSMGYLSGLVIGVILGCIMTDENHEWFVEIFGRKQHKKNKKQQRHTR